MPAGHPSRVIFIGKRGSHCTRRSGLARRVRDRPALVPGKWMMADKTLRILIADELGQQAVQIERTLNHLGYFRVVAVHTLDELLVMVQSAYQPFDLLIANTDMAVRSGVDLPRFCKNTEHVRHALLYESQKQIETELTDASGERLRTSVMQLPDLEALKTFMAIVESPKAPLGHRVRVIGDGVRTRKSLSSPSL
ncbi:MAG: histidine kinase [Oxalobacteraceae bacterium]|nr:MAG: histidine kinase [Oxalobacteraceae bacterium]